MNPAFELQDYMNSWIGIFSELNFLCDFGKNKPTPEQILKVTLEHQVGTVEEWTVKDSYPLTLSQRAEVLKKLPDRVVKLNDLARQINTCTTAEEFKKIWEEMLSVLYSEKKPTSSIWW